MASTISSASMTVTLTESLVLNGVNQGSTKKMTITGVTAISKRIMSTLHTGTGTQVYQGHLDTASIGQFIYGEVKYIRITNLDADNSVAIHIEDTSNTAYAQFLIPAGHVFFLTDAAGSYGNNSTAAIPTGNIEKINVMAQTAAVDVEVMVATGPSS
tara:strand:+ start:3081 stop:3551 length:471 start_codon:yes stop_codon:yes gene_type:complete